MPAGGGAALQITSIGGADSPAWSPDGTAIAFDRGSGIWVVPAGGGTAIQLTEGPDSQPAWSPDGALVASTPARTPWRGTAGMRRAPP